VSGGRFKPEFDFLVLEPATLTVGVREKRNYPLGDVCSLRRGKFMLMPLEGIRVVDWTIWQQGPVASVMLGDLGAEVIKIEERVGGDPGRGLLRMGGIDLTDRPNFYFEANNRNKKSVALDLKTPAGVRSCTSSWRSPMSSSKTFARAWPRGSDSDAITLRSTTRS